MIIIDDEHSDGARITLEKGGRNARFAITCGIYSWMVHTRFFEDESVARQALEEMKKDIESILAVIPFNDDPALDQKMAETVAAINDFVQRHP